MKVKIYTNSNNIKLFYSSDSKYDDNKQEDTNKK